MQALEVEKRRKRDRRADGDHSDMEKAAKLPPAPTKKKGQGYLEQPGRKYYFEGITLTNT